MGSVWMSNRIWLYVGPLLWLSAVPPKFTLKLLIGTKTLRQLMPINFVSFVQKPYTQPVILVCCCLSSISAILYVLFQSALQCPCLITSCLKFVLGLQRVVRLALP